MQTTETALHSYRQNRHFRTALIAVTTLLTAAVLLLWAWNTLAAGLFGLGTAQFKHALAGEAGLAGLAAIFFGVQRLFR
jgi:hypothetical protein